jgi:heptosyltransferase I
MFNGQPINFKQPWLFFYACQSMKILIVRVSSLGDVIHNMPMVQDILRHHPAAQIDWVVEEAYAGLVRLNPGVRNIIPVALRRWRKRLWSKAVWAEIRHFRRLLQTEAYDYVFDTQGLLKTGVLMGWARLAPGGQKLGLANGTEGSGYEGISRWFHTRSVRVALRCHAVARGREVAAAAFGYSVDVADNPADFGLAQVRFAAQPAWLPKRPASSSSSSSSSSPPSVPFRYAVFFHGTARAAKKWPVANWVQMGRYLGEQGWLILLPWGSAEEKQAAQEMAVQIPAAQVLPALPLLEAVQLAQSANLVLGVDTGLTHMAAAFERPTIELYCDSARWKTECNWSDQVINLGDIGQVPSVAEVMAALERLLKTTDLDGDAASV